MVPVLNCIGVHAAAVGNHDCELRMAGAELRVGRCACDAALTMPCWHRLSALCSSALFASRRFSPALLPPRLPPAAVDFGIPQLQAHMQQFRFPWLLSNVLDARTGEPLGGCERSRIVTWQGVRVGLMGLVEREVRKGVGMQLLPTVSSIAAGVPSCPAALPARTSPPAAALSSSHTLPALLPHSPRCSGC